MISNDTIKSILESSGLKYSESAIKNAMNAADAARRGEAPKVAPEEMVSLAMGGGSVSGFVQSFIGKLTPIKRGFSGVMAYLGDQLSGILSASKPAHASFGAYIDAEVDRDVATAVTRSLQGGNQPLLAEKSDLLVTAFKDPDAFWKEESKKTAIVAPVVTVPAAPMAPLVEIAAGSESRYPIKAGMNGGAMLPSPVTPAVLAPATKTK